MVVAVAFADGAALMFGRVVAAPEFEDDVDDEAASLTAACWVAGIVGVAAKGLHGFRVGAVFGRSLGGGGFEEIVISSCW